MLVVLLILENADCVLHILRYSTSYLTGKGCGSAIDHDITKIGKLPQIHTPLLGAHLSAT